MVRIYLVIILLSLNVCAAKSQFWNVNMDIKTAEQITANTLLQAAMEVPHNLMLDSINSIQEEKAFKYTTIAEYKNLALMTYKNIKGFDEESIYYKQIVKTAVYIADQTPGIISAISKSNLVNKANVILSANKLLTKGYQCVNDFVNIVGNAKIQNPLQVKASNSITKADDGENILDRYERLGLAQKILGDLKSVSSQLQYIKYLAEHSTPEDLMRTLDFKSLANIYQGKTIANNLIQQWNRTIK